MDINAATRLLVIIMTGSVSVLAIVYALTDQRRASKKVYRAFEAIALLWLMVVYIAATMGSKDPNLLNGLYTRTAVIALTGLVAGEILSDWRRR
jgi:hypothetical protein